MPNGFQQPVNYNGQDPNTGQGYPPTGGQNESYGAPAPWNGGMAGMPPDQNGSYSPWNAGQIPQPQPADYQSVQNFSDAAYNNARRYLDPQQEQDQRRLSQEQINRGVAPNSVQGQEMGDQMAMQHGDQDIASAFAGMQFGQGVQNQLYNQNIAGGNLQLGRQAQDFSELMGYDAMDFRNAGFNENNMRWDQNLAMQMAGFGMPDTGSLGQGGGQGIDSQVSPWSGYVGRQRDIWGQ